MNDLDIIVTGIGSRTTPASEQAKMTEFARAVVRHGGIVRSGGARGADTAFALGLAPANQEIYLPFANFQGVKNGEGVFVLDALPSDVRVAALAIAKRFHPNWSAVENKGQAAVKLMTRNVFQVLGRNLNDPSHLVVMWAKGTRTTVAKKDSLNRIFDVDGGTGLAVRLAHSLHIPVLHTQLPEHENILRLYQHGRTAEFEKALFEEGRWAREETLAKVKALREVVGLEKPTPTFVPTGRWTRTPSA